MNLQDMLEQQDVERPFRMLLYGVAGIGKSTFAAHAPAPIFIQTEDGLIDIDAPRTKLCRSFAQFMSYLNAMREARDQFKTIVVDSLDWLEELMTIDVLQCPEAVQKKYTKLSDFPYGRGGMELKPRAVAVLNALKCLYYDGFNILLIAHTKPEKVVNPDGTDYDQHSPRLNKNINPLFKEWADIIAFANFDFTIQERTDGMTHTVKAVATKDGRTQTALRTITLTGSPAVVAKCRYRNIPDVMPLNGKLFFDTLANRSNNDNDQLQ